MTEKLPYLFLDIDGCLNAFGFKPGISRAHIDEIKEFLNG